MTWILFERIPEPHNEALHTTSSSGQAVGAWATTSVFFKDGRWMFEEVRRLADDPHFRRRGGRPVHAIGDAIDTNIKHLINTSRFFSKITAPHEAVSLCQAARLSASRALPCVFINHKHS